jgi:hypothetical protein
MGRVMRIQMLAVACAAGLSGCATLIDGSDQYITINSGSVHYAHCVLTRPGERFNVTTPGSIHIEKSENDLNVRCSRPGYVDAVTTIPSDLDPWTFGNLVTAGLTAGVDADTGAMYEYPREFDIPMTRGLSQPDASAAYSSPYSVPPAPAPAPMAAEPLPAPQAAFAPPPADNGKPLPGTLPDNY